MFYRESSQVVLPGERVRMEQGLYAKGKMAFQSSLHQKTSEIKVPGAFYDQFLSESEEAGVKLPEHVGGLRKHIISEATGAKNTIDIVSIDDHSIWNGNKYVDTASLDNQRRPLKSATITNTDEGFCCENLAGFIFMCNRRTMKECFHHGVFGLPYNSWENVSQIAPGTILFLFEYEARKMWGIYEAVSHGTLNINAQAYSRGSFPAQVRFKDIEKCPPLTEEEFKDAIKENYFTDVKFKFSLSYDQVFSLCKAFLWKLTVIKEIENRRLSQSPEINLEESNDIDRWYGFPSGRHMGKISKEGVYGDHFLVESAIAGNMNRLGHFPSSQFQSQSRLPTSNVEVEEQRGIMVKPSLTVCQENFPLDDNTHKLKPSVWSRISICWNVDEAFEEGSVEWPLRNDVREDSFQVPEKVNKDALQEVDSREGISYDQTDNNIPVNFKRRRSKQEAELSQRMEDIKGKRRRKLTRPDFSGGVSSKDDCKVKTANEVDLANNVDDRVTRGTHETISNENCILDADVHKDMENDSLCVNQNKHNELIEVLSNGGIVEQEKDEMAHKVSVEVERAKECAHDVVSGRSLDLNEPIGELESSLLDRDNSPNIDEPNLQLELGTARKIEIFQYQEFLEGPSLGLSLDQGIVPRIDPSMPIKADLKAHECSKHHIADEI